MTDNGPMSAQAPTATYQPVLDGYRGIAVLIVYFYHAFVPGFRGGFLGVDLFFVLSGYLITGLILRETATSRGLSLKRFYIRRGLRILPPLLLTILGLWWFSSLVAPDIGFNAKQVQAALLFYSNFVSIQEHFSMGFLTHTWTLAIEEQYYLVWPLLLWALSVWRVRRWHIVLLLFVIVGLLTWNLYLLSSSGASFTRLAWATDTRSVGLFIGSALACLQPMQGRGSRWLLVGAGLSGVLLFVFMVSMAQGSHLLMVHEFGILITALAAAGIVLHLTQLRDGPLHRILMLPPLRWTGRISYGLYLYHGPIILYCNVHWRDWSMVSRVSGMLALSYTLAVASWFIVERPLLKLKDRWAP